MLNLITNTVDRMRTLADKLAFVGPTLARLTIGLVFIGTGWGKLHALGDVTQFFASLHIPAPGFNARLAASTEFFGGILILIGLGTRLATLPVAFTMVIAILTAKRADIDGVTALVGFEEWSYFTMCVWLAVAGSGPLSLDALLSRFLRRQRSSTADLSNPPLAAVGAAQGGP